MSSISIFFHTITSKQQRAVFRIAKYKDIFVPKIVFAILLKRRLAKFTLHLTFKYFTDEDYLHLVSAPLISPILQAAPALTHKEKVLGSRFRARRRDSFRVVLNLLNQERWQEWGEEIKVPVSPLAGDWGIMLGGVTRLWDATVYDIGRPVTGDVALCHQVIHFPNTAGAIHAPLFVYDHVIICNNFLLGGSSFRKDVFF